MHRKEIKFFFISLIFLSSLQINGQSDSLAKKLHLEIELGGLLGQSILLEDTDVSNINYKLNTGTYLAYKINSTSAVKIGYQYSRSFYDYRIINRNVPTINGTFESQELFKEDISFTLSSLNLSYEYSIGSRSSILMGFAANKILSEKGKREGVLVASSEGLLFEGIDYSTDDFYYGLNFAYSFRVLKKPFIRFSINLSNENIVVPRISGESNINLLSGLLVAYQL